MAFYLMEGGEQELVELMKKYGPKRIRRDKLILDVEKERRRSVLLPGYNEYSDEELEGREVRCVRKAKEAELKKVIEDYDFLACRGHKKVPDESKLRLLPAGWLLNLKRRTKIEHMRIEMIKPKRHVPPTHMPEWFHWSLDTKIPLIESGSSLKYSRGNLGQPLMQNFSKPAFTLDDPLNLRTVPDYSALHDPGTKSYLMQPAVQKQLKKQGLINEDDEVICSIAELNRYRVYLRSHHYTELHSLLKYMDNRETHNRKENHSLCHYKASISQKALKSKAMKSLLNDEDTYKTHVQHRVVHGHERKLGDHENKEERKAKAVWVKLKQEEAKYEYLEAIRELTKNRAKKITENKLARAKANYRAKHKNIEKRLEQRRKIGREANRQYQLDWLDAKFEHQLERGEQDYGISMAARDEIKEKAKLYLREVEAKRKALPDIIERYKADRDRIHELTKKYFYIWLHNVRERRAIRPDIEHQSAWDIDAVTHELTEYLHKKSGYALKFDDIIQDMILKNARMLRKIMHDKRHAKPPTIKKHKKRYRDDSFSKAHFIHEDSDSD